MDIQKTGVLIKADDRKGSNRVSWDAYELSYVTWEHGRFKDLIPVIERLKRRFRVRDIVIVAERRMVSKETIDELNNSRIR